MTYYIVEPCIDLLDKSCVEVCPVDCIHYEEGSDRMEYIDPDECIDCGACEPVCPVTAIFAEDDLPEDQAAYADININWFKDPDAVRAELCGHLPRRAEYAEQRIVELTGAGNVVRAKGYVTNHQDVSIGNIEALWQSSLRINISEDERLLKSRRSANTPCPYHQFHLTQKHWYFGQPSDWLGWLGRRTSS